MPGHSEDDLAHRIKQMEMSGDAERTAALEAKLADFAKRASEPRAVDGKFADSAPPVEHILQFFAYAHLPPHLQEVSKPFCVLAHAIVLGDGHPDPGKVTLADALPRNPERTVALRKLLESKDAAVRALVAK